jgi:ubiquinone/menaquinone biosynthesis C-methylase UbiE
MDRAYGLFARPYDLCVRVLPVWKTWLRHALPHIEGPRVLEVSFGTGFLLTQYADRFETEGIDYNEKMVAVARRNLDREGIHANLQQGNVEALPYASGHFDCIVNTMAFSGYPDGQKAMSELHRVLKPGGKLVIIDVGHPGDRNWIGMKTLRLWTVVGDLIRDLGKLLHEFGFEYSKQEIGGFGTVHLYVATKLG